MLTPEVELHAPEWYSTTSTDIIWGIFNFPLKTVQHVHQLEEMLHSHSIFRKEFILKFSSLECPMTHKSKFLYANTVVDALFERELLTHFSWTGCSSTRRMDKKYPFKCLLEIMRTVYEIVSVRTDHYTEEVNENFFKVNILKCSSYRFKKQYDIIFYWYII